MKTKYFTQIIGFIALLFSSVNMLAQTATLVSDQADYAPGTTATLTGTGFQTNEMVTMQVLHYDGTSDGGEDHQPWEITADALGNFVTTWHVCEDDCVGSTLRATADGQSSGLHAEAVFTDNDGDGTVTVFSNPASICAGTTGNDFVFQFRTKNGTTGAYASGSQATITIPIGWTTPQTSSVSSPGFISVSPVGSGSTASFPTLPTPTITGTGPWTVLINFTCSAGTTNGFNLSYGGGGTKITSPAAGSHTYTTQTKNGSTGTLKDLSPANAQPTVIVNSLPNATISAIPTCSNSAGNTASVVTAGTGATYSWSISNGSITAGAGTRSISYTAGTSGSVILAVTVTNGNGCQASSGNTSVTINPLPVATITSAESVCSNSLGNIATAPDAGPGATYSWSISNGSITAGTGTRSITFTAGASGFVTLAATVSNDNGCQTSSGNKLVTINPSPIASISAVAVCTNSLGNTASVPDAGAGATYSWRKSVV